MTSCRVDYIYPAVIPLLSVIESCGQIYRVFIVDFARFLLKGFVFIVEYIGHKIVAEYSAYPVARHEQADEARRSTHYI